MTKVGIIGAGLAGLSCGYSLAKSGIDFQIFEATDRIGGRVMTYRHSTGETVELGAGYFHDFYPTTLSLIKELGLESEIIPRSHQRVGFVQDDQVIALRDLGVDNSLFTSIVSIKSNAVEYCKKVNLFIATYISNNKTFIEAMSEDPWLVEAHHTPFIVSEFYQSLEPAIQKYFVKPFLRKQLSSEPEEVSLMTAVSALGASEFHLKTLQSGMSLLPETLYSKIKDHVSLEQPIANVHREGNKWILLSNNEEYRCDAVVATAPGTLLTKLFDYKNNIKYGSTNVFVIEGEKHNSYKNCDILFSENSVHKIVGSSRYSERLFKVESFDPIPDFDYFFKSYKIQQHQIWKDAIPQIPSNNVYPSEQLAENFYLAGDCWFPCMETAIATGLKAAKKIISPEIFTSSIKPKTL